MSKRISMCIMMALFAGAATPVMALPDGINGFRREAAMIPVGVRPAAVRAMDLNGDGVSDFVVANEGPTDVRFNGDVRVLLSDGAGGYTAAPILTNLLLERPGSLDLADIDGDGFTDLVVGDRDEEFVYRFIGIGNGAFLPADRFLASQPIGGPPLGVSSLRLGAPDTTDEEAIIELVTGSARIGLGGNPDGEGFISFLGNIGAGAFASPQSVEPTFSLPRIELADMDGDGFLDVVWTETANNGAFFIKRYLVATGGFDAVTMAAVQSLPSPQAFALADVNMDDRPDLLWTTDPDVEGIPTTKGLLLRFNLSSSGSLAFSCAGGFCAENFVGNDKVAVTLATGDVNDDGTPDVALGHIDDDNTVSILRNVDAADDFPLADEVQLGAVLGVKAITFADVDQDGDNDLIVLARPDDASGDPGYLAIFENFTLGAPAPDSFNLVGPTASPAIGFAGGEDCFTPEDVPFGWQASAVPEPLTVTYTLQISNESTFPPGVDTLEISGITGTTHTVDGADLQAFTNNFMHYWRVIASSNVGGETVSSAFTFTTRNRADFNNDGEVDGADLATLLSLWGQDGQSTCTDVVENGVIDGGDLAFLLANWTGAQPPEAVMAMPSFGGDQMDAELLTESEAPTAASASNVPWVIAHFGFSSLNDYVTWLDLLDEAQMTAHVLELIALIQGE